MGNGETKMEPEIKRILFASDLSEEARHAFGYARNIAICHGAVILIVHVVEGLSAGTEERVETAFGQDLYAELKRRKTETAHDILINKRIEAVRARDALDRMCEEASTSGLDASAVVEDITVVEGDVAAETLSIAREKECDLIVMGSRRRSRLAKVFVGDAVQNVLRQSDKLVLVVPAKAERPSA
jgi:nucleotide-binding universal stress UspA family protein